MNDEMILREIYLTLERLKVKNLVERSRDAARAAGAVFSNKQAGEWLAPFIAQHRKVADGKRTGLRTGSGTENGRGNRAQTDEIRTETRTDLGAENGLTRDKGIPSTKFISTHTHTAGAREEESEQAYEPPPKPDPVADFVRWFVATGVESKAVPKHLDFELEVQREMLRSTKDAKAMLDEYGRPECERRSRLFFASLMAPKGQGRPWITTLSERWSWYEPRTEEPRGRDSPRTLRSVPEPPHNPDHDMIPDPIDPNTADLAAIFARRQQ